MQAKHTVEPLFDFGFHKKCVWDASTQEGRENSREGLKLPELDDVTRRYWHVRLSVSDKSVIYLLVVSQFCQERGNKRNCWSTSSIRSQKRGADRLIWAKQTFDGSCDLRRGACIKVQVGLESFRNSGEGVPMVSTELTSKSRYQLNSLVSVNAISPQ